MTVEEIVGLFKRNHESLKDIEINNDEVLSSLSGELTDFLVTCRGFSRTNFRILSDKMKEVGLFIHWRVLSSDRFGPLRMGIDVWDAEDEYDSPYSEDYVRYTVAFG